MIGFLIFIKDLNYYSEGELVKALPKDLAIAMLFDSLMDVKSSRLGEEPGWPDLYRIEWSG